MNEHQKKVAEMLNSTMTEKNYGTSWVKEFKKELAIKLADIYEEEDKQYNNVCAKCGLPDYDQEHESRCLFELSKFNRKQFLKKAEDKE